MDELFTISVGDDLCDPCHDDGTTDTCGSGLECGDDGYCICANGTVAIEGVCCKLCQLS